MRKETTVYLWDSTEEEIVSRGQTFDDWFADQISLAIMIDKGVILQQIGDELLVLNMRDIVPYKELDLNKTESSIVNSVTVNEEAYEEIQNKTGTFKNWILRVLNLGLMAPQMSLYFLDTDGPHPLIYTPDPAPDTP